MEEGNPETLLERYVRKYEHDPEFVAEELAIKITEEMLEWLALNNRSQSWLAEEMGVSRAHISRILNARPNMTLLTIAKIAVALGLKPDVSLGIEAGEVRPRQVETISEGETRAHEHHTRGFGS